MDRPKIKYLGNADIARIEKGETIDGKVGDPLTMDLEWNEKNHHLIDFSEEKYSGVPDVFLQVLTEHDSRFKDVTGMQRIPTSAFQQIFRASGLNAPSPEAEEAKGVAASGTSDSDTEGAAGSTSGTAGGSKTGRTGPGSR